jgi:hypothetical protein
MAGTTYRGKHRAKTGILILTGIPEGAKPPFTENASSYLTVYARSSSSGHGKSQEHLPTLLNRRSTATTSSSSSWRLSTTSSVSSQVTSPSAFSDLYDTADSSYTFSPPTSGTSSPRSKGAMSPASTPSSRRSSTNDVGGPTPSLAQLSALTLDTDSSGALAARLSLGRAQREANGSGTMISDPAWVIGEDEREWDVEGDGKAFDPYQLRRTPSPVQQQESPQAEPVTYAPVKEEERRARRGSRTHSRSRSRGSRSPTHHVRGRSRSKSKSRSRTPDSRVALANASRNPMRRWTLTMSDSCYDDAVLQEFDALRGPAMKEERGRDERTRVTDGDGQPVRGPRKRRSRTMMPGLRMGEEDAAAMAGTDVNVEALSEGHGESRRLKARTDDTWTEWWRAGVRGDAVVYGGPSASSSPVQRGLSTLVDAESTIMPVELSPVLSAEADDQGWLTAKRALLCCRDMVRTEKSYQAKLKQLLGGDVSVHSCQSPRCGSNRRCSLIDTDTAANSHANLHPRSHPRLRAPRRALGRRPDRMGRICRAHCP